MMEQIKGILYKPDGSTEDVDIDIIDNLLVGTTFDPINRTLIEKSEITPDYLEKLAAKGRQYLDECNNWLAEECFRFKEAYEEKYVNKNK